MRFYTQNIQIEARWLNKLYFIPNFAYFAKLGLNISKVKTL